MSETDVMFEEMIGDEATEVGEKGCVVSAYINLEG
jgi:hypothetical protein